jgi:hypothetical protein
MDKTAVLDKSGVRGVCGTRADLCPSCGQPMAPGRCRELPGRGQDGGSALFCWVNGLLDGSTNVLKIQAAFTLAVSQDPRVVAAQSQVDRLTAEAERATTEWQRAWIKAHNARNRRLALKKDVAINGGAQLLEWTPAGVPTPADIAHLDELATQADTLRQEADWQVTKARRLLDDAMTRARQRVVAQGY